MTNDPRLTEALERIANALESQAGQPPASPDWNSARAFVWQSGGVLKPVETVAAHPLSLLVGVEEHAATLLQNTRQFANGRPANNALLWGARGMGKSALVKAVHAEISKESGNPLILVEIHREDIPDLTTLLDLLRQEKTKRFVLFCDDLSFDEGEAGYKALKSLLDGGIEGRPGNVLFYATSNRRHLLPRQMIENERATAIHRGEAVEEKISLSDRFGLWLAFYSCDQDTYLQIVDNYVDHFGIKIDTDTLHRQALKWAITRGTRSGRTAWQFVQDLAGRLKAYPSPSSAAISASSAVT